MVAALPPVIAIAGVALYFVTSFRLARYRKYAWEFLAIVAAGATLGVVLFYDAPSPRTAISAASSLALFVGAIWFLFVFSMYGAREEEPRVGDAFPEFSLPDSQGGMFRLSEARGHKLLLVFYRGAW